MNIHVFSISETATDSLFLTAQFYIEWYTTPYRLERYRLDIHDGGLLLSIREDIPSSLLHSCINRRLF